MLSENSRWREERYENKKTLEEDPLLLHVFLSRHPNLRLLYLHDPKVFLSDFWMAQRSLKFLIFPKIS